MKLTKTKLQQIIKEELDSIINEYDPPTSQTFGIGDPGSMNSPSQGERSKKCKDAGGMMAGGECQDPNTGKPINIEEELDALDDDGYNYNNPPPAEMIADALQDGLKKLIPAYDADDRMENIVHERVMAFASELYELMEEPEISVDPERYYDPDVELKES